MTVAKNGMESIGLKWNEKKCVVIHVKRGQVKQGSGDVKIADLKPGPTYSNTYRAFSHDVTAAILVFQNTERAAMLVYQENPLGV